MHISFVLLLMIAGFFWGGVVGKLRIPAGSGLAGPAIFLGYALSGVIVGLLLGLFSAAKLNEAQLRKGLLIAVILAVIALVAVFLIPKKTVPVPAYQLPAPFSPPYTLDFSIVYGSPENPPHTLDLPFNRYLNTQPPGKEFMRLMQIVYEDVKPNMWCN